MGQGKQDRRGKGRSAASKVAMYTVMLTMISGAAAPYAQAASSSRAAQVVEVTGNVTYKKSGGSKSNYVYQDLKLNQGDYISVGPSSSLTLKIVDHGDELTIGENSEVYISELLDSGNGKTSKVKSWAGTLWSKVKSLVSSEDEFEVETPTAVMGVRGTHFLTYYNPQTGETTLVVAAGVVGATTASSTSGSSSGGPGSGSKSQEVKVYPSQQLNLDQSTKSTDLKSKVDYADPNKIVIVAPPKVLEALIKNAADIQAELKEQKDKLNKDLQQGKTKPDEQSTLKFQDDTDLNKIKGNFDALLPNLAKQAVDGKKIDTSVIDKANASIPDPNQKIDLNHVTPIDKSAGLDPEIQKIKEQAGEYFNQLLHELVELQQNQQQLASLVRQLEADKQRTDEQNKEAIKAADQKASEQYASSLDAAAKKEFETNKQKNETSGINPAAQPTAPTTPSSSSSSSNNNSTNTTPPVTAPDPVQLVSPSAAGEYDLGTIKITAKAPADTKILLMNGTETVAYAQGNGDQPVELSLPDKSYTGLTLVSEKNGVRGSAVSVPALSNKAPQAVLSEVSRSATSVKYRLELSNVPALYAVQAHMTYDAGALNYAPAGTSSDLPDAPNTVFDGSNIAETLRQVQGQTKNELIYAATFFEASTSNPTSNIRLSGSKTAVEFTLDVVNTVTPGTGNASAQLVSIKVADKTGNVVFQLPTSP
ncbi:FecR domain-containing protein [Paenibacillus cremeus]|uniref:FecR protein domain-containing protein n=1 Tax=Paenibacillus cremeus TaxID=2163881 RepID=A0A559K818_9BACL|nr:FecR domain-containing protein [Paenibacillus cremeus]TVY08268.1 hypothetical protein FPZ49_19560 [Paenibacillus cremeus]